MYDDDFVKNKGASEFGGCLAVVYESFTILTPSKNRPCTGRNCFCVVYATRKCGRVVL